MRAKLVDDTVKIYAEPQDQSLSIATLNKDDEFEMGKVTRKKKDVWVEVTLPGGQTGYLPGGTKIFTLKKIQTLTDNIELREEANAESPIIKSLPKNSIVTAIGVDNSDSKGWVKILDGEGVTGFVRGDAKIRLYQEPTKEGARKLILTGGAFVIFAAVYYYFTVIATKTASNMQILIAVIVIFGLIQCGQGVMQLMAYKKLEEEKKGKQQ